MPHKAASQARACAAPCCCHRTRITTAAAAAAAGLLLLACAAAAAGTTTVPVEVGVILDLATALGKKSLLSLEMAVEDFYAAHPEFATRLRLHVRDSDRDVVAAASHAIDLIDNKKVNVIIGPQNTLQAEFVTYLANKTKVPVISFSATGDAVTQYHIPYFFRACVKDSFLASSIAAFVKAYGWKNVFIVHEDNNYGIGILPSIIDALQDVEAHVINRSAIPASSPDYLIDLELFWHDKGYGVIGFRPYVANSARILDFTTRFVTLFRAKYSQDLEVRTMRPTVFQYWAYDVIWAIATAAEEVKIGSSNISFQTSGYLGKNLADDLLPSPSGPELRSSIFKADFDGLAGSFMFDRRTPVPVYEIVNVRGEKARGIGFWIPGSGLSKFMNKSSANHGQAKIFIRPDEVLEHVIWPGDSRIPPKGWDYPVNAKILKIGVPLRHDFKFWVNVETDPITERSTKFDAAVGDVTIIANRTKYVDFTMPYTESGVSMLVLAKTNDQGTMWIFLEPQTKGLWIATMLGQNISSFRSKVVVVSWCFVVLVLVQSYTASLSSLLTAKRLQPSVTDLDQLRRNGNYVGYQSGSFVQAMLRRPRFDESRIKVLSTLEDYANALRPGSVSAIFDVVPYLNSKLVPRTVRKRVPNSQSCRQDRWIRFCKILIFPIGSPLVSDLSKAILNLTEGCEGSDVPKKCFRDTAPYFQSESSDSDSQRLSFESFKVLFISHGIILAIMVLISLKQLHFPSQQVSEETVGENGPQQSHDDMATDSVPAEVQRQNGPAIDSVPADSLQAETADDNGPEQSQDGIAINTSG
ncbi:hypothetical protein ACP4OV_017595 [Aristida adscensionis]